MNFLAAYSAAKLELVRDLTKSWDLVTSGTSKPLKVTEEEVVVVDVGGASSSFLPLFLVCYSLSLILYPLLTPCELLHRLLLGR